MNLSYIFAYLLNYKSYFVALLLGLLTSYYTAKLITNSTVPLVIAPQVVSSTEETTENYSQVITNANPFNSQIDSGASAISTANVQSLDYQLIGTFVGDKSSVALLKGAEENLTVATGEQLGDCTLSTVTIDTVLFYCNDQEVSLEIQQSETVSSSRPSTTPSAFTIPQSSDTSGGTQQLSYSRKELLEAFGDINKIFSTALVEPVYRDSVFYGYRVAALSGKSPLLKLGVQKGDIILRINGEATNNPAALYGLLDKVNELNSLSIDLERDNLKTNIFINIT